MSDFNTVIEAPTLPVSKEIEMKELLPNKCKNCRFWDRTGKLRTGLCDSRFVKYCQALNDQVPIGGIGYSDVDNYSASIEFDQDFGCVNYKIRRRP